MDMQRKKPLSYVDSIMDAGVRGQGVRHNHALTSFLKERFHCLSNDKLPSPVCLLALFEANL